VAEDEQELTGGNASERVVRVGNPVRKPWLEKSAVVQSYLGALRGAGVDVPEPLGRDKEGRYVIEYVEGVSALDQLPLGHAELLRVGRMIRQIHDASEAMRMSIGFEPRLRANCSLGGTQVTVVREERIRAV
jgi:aminoglycoside phosphotransferase (APT) family kinase protein